MTFPLLLTEVADSRFLTPFTSEDDENDETPTNPGFPCECETPTGESSPPKRESKLGRAYNVLKDKMLTILNFLLSIFLQGWLGKC